MYWDTSMKVNVFWENISRDRFLELRTNLHLVNNLEKPPENKDKFYKFSPVYTAIRKRCSDLPTEENVCVDEGIIPFTGKFAAKQCVRGNQVHGESMSSCCVESVLLFQVLKSQGINAAGTVRQNRFGKNLPISDDKTITKQARGYCEEITSADEITMCKWLDNRPIVLCSIFFGKGSMDEVELWDKKHHKYVKVERPEIISKMALRMILHGVDFAIVQSWLEIQTRCRQPVHPKEEGNGPSSIRIRAADGLILCQKKVTEKKRGHLYEEGLASDMRVTLKKQRRITTSYRDTV
ncbi:piggyBac transposable element-derived protein 3-like [Schistocerca nitens]|uniref:piggyBac transposable element-derived protein 3-like n=1 Tax=Schistocerca nitens TaxID=7011 RepID=UPI0021180B6B|nr:piggyBac transposable element-derived protein 3-like [Schistocerca nitens]